MQGKCTGTWQDDPAHFERPSRRSFLFVGLAGGLGLSLGDMFRLQAVAGTQSPKGKDPPARSLCPEESHRSRQHVRR